MSGVSGRSGLSWTARIVRRLRSFLSLGSARTRDDAWHAGEDLASAHLRRLGYRIVRRNAVTPRGEADILARTPDGSTLVVVEVKARRVGLNPRSDTRPPELALTAAKRRRLRGIASHLARANAPTPVRVDLIAVELRPDGKPTLRHYERVA